MTISQVRRSDRYLHVRIFDQTITLLYRRCNHLLSRVFGVARSSGPPRSNSFFSHSMSSSPSCICFIDFFYGPFPHCLMSSVEHVTIRHPPKAQDQEQSTARRKAVGSPFPR